MSFDSRLPPTEINGFPVTTVGPTAYYSRSGEFLGTNVDDYGNIIPFSPRQAEEKLREKQRQEMVGELQALEEVKKAFSFASSSHHFPEMRHGDYLLRALQVKTETTSLRKLDLLEILGMNKE